MEQKDGITIELRSEPMNEMLSEPPKWVIRFGSGVALSVLFLVIGLTWFIQYPDEIEGDVIVKTSGFSLELSEPRNVVNQDDGNYNAFTIITAAGKKKVKAGQKVFIDLNDYPKSEFGMLEGTVSSVIPLDTKGKYEVRIELPQQLTTTFGRQIPPTAQFNGRARIIIKNTRLLTRLFEQLTGNN